MFTLVIWYNPNKKEYYYKILKHFTKRYKQGFINQYGHEVILVIDLHYNLFYKKPFIKRVITKIISFLQYIDKKL